MSTRHALVMVHPDADTGPGTGRLELVPPDTDTLHVTDLGATRGDGVFETLSVVRGRPLGVEDHLERFARSATALDLGDIDPALWQQAIAMAASTMEPVHEASAKVVLTRGREGSQHRTGWVWCTPSPDFTTERTQGIAIVLLDRGYRSDIGATAPWLLAGAKTLSYAINRAALREAVRRGAQDALFVSTDGYLLEGPNSTLIVQHGRMLSTPPPAQGLLSGTTQLALFEHADTLGLETRYRTLLPDDLHSADAAWLVSSVRNVAPIRSVDGVPRRVDRALTDAFNAYLSERGS